MAPFAVVPWVSHGRARHRLPPVTPHALAQAYVLGRAPNTPGVALRSLLPLYLPANTNPAISAAAFSCIAGMACEQVSTVSRRWHGGCAWRRPCVMGTRRSRRCDSSATKATAEAARLVPSRDTHANHSGWSRSTAGRSRTSSLVRLSRTPSSTPVTALIGMATLFWPQRWPSSSKTCVT